MEFNNIISILKDEARPLEITFIHGDTVTEANCKEIVATFKKNESLGITFGDAVDESGKSFVEVISIIAGSNTSLRHVVKPGDIVNKVNNVNVRNLPFVEVL